MQLTPVKAGKGQFKCFHCRQIFAMKDGDWVDWDSMQVHLCRTCEKKTADEPQRAQGEG